MSKELAQGLGVRAQALNCDVHSRASPLQKVVFASLTSLHKSAMSDKPVASEYCTPEVEQWFLEFDERMSKTKTVEIDPVPVRKPFVEMERSCSSIAQRIESLESDLNVTMSNMYRISQFSTNCQFAASAANIFAENISPVVSPEGTVRKMANAVLSFVHEISNWIFAFFDECL